MAEPIEGLVSTVVSTREIAINRGTKDGVTEGMVFAVLAESPVVITDPEDGTVLGEIDREKVRVQASEVSEKFTIGRTFQRYQARGGLFSAAALLGGTKARYKTLRVEDSELPPPLAEEESVVKRGDRVRQVVEPVSVEEEEEEE